MSIQRRRCPSPRSSSFMTPKRHHPVLRCNEPIYTLKPHTRNHLAMGHITAQHTTSIPGLLLLALYPNSRTPISTFVTTRVVFASYAPLRLHQGHESGFAHWPAGAGPRARPSSKDAQLLKFFPSAHGLLIVIHACPQARDLR